MTKITVNDNGPLRIEGDMTICDASGKEFGLAGRDGSHARQGWQSQCEARDLPPPKPKV